MRRYTQRNDMFCIIYFGVALRVSQEGVGGGVRRTSFAFVTTQL